MEIVFIAFGTISLGLAFSQFGNDKPIAIWTWFVLSFGIIAFGCAILVTWKKERKADKDRMDRENREIEREKREQEREKRDVERFNKENTLL